MNKQTQMFLIFLLLFSSLFLPGAFSQALDTQKQNPLMDVIHELEKILNDAAIQIQKADMQIRNAENAIRRAEDAIKLSLEVKGSEAERIARQALTIAQNAKSKGQELKVMAERMLYVTEKQIKELKLISQKGDAQTAQHKTDRARKEVALLQQLDEGTWMEFQRQLINSRGEADKRFKQLMADIIQNIKVPPPEKPRVIEEGIFLGMFGSQSYADKLIKEEKSPFSGRPYAEMHKEGKAMAIGFAASGAGTLEELDRVIGDHLTMGYTLNKEYVKSIMPAIQGTEFKRLVAHSNGATVAEALIRQDVIKVNELNILGGDRSLVNRESLQELLDSGKVKRVVVWVNAYDPIPILTGTPISQSIEKARAAAYYWCDLGNKRFGNMSDLQVEYRPFIEKGPKDNVWGPHFLRETYFPEIRKEYGAK